MTSKEFVIWMKGFMEACNDFTATPKQWDRIKEELDKINDSPTSTIVTGANTSATYLNTHANWTYTNGENKKQQLND